MNQIQKLMLKQYLRFLLGILYGFSAAEYGMHQTLVV